MTSQFLTLRQQQIVLVLASGGTNREIAHRLGVREQTIKNQLSVIYAKVGVRNRLELAIFATKRALREYDSGSDRRTR